MIGQEQYKGNGSKPVHEVLLYVTECEVLVMDGDNRRYEANDGDEQTQASSANTPVSRCASESVDAALRQTRTTREVDEQRHEQMERTHAASTLERQSSCPRPSVL